MVQAGWEAEVRRLVEAGHEPHLDRLKALGYREMAGYLRGEQPLEQVVDATKQHHRRYAKRQLTWFRGDARIHWLRASPDTPAAHYLEGALRVLALHGWKGAGL